MRMNPFGLSLALVVSLTSLASAAPPAEFVAWSSQAGFQAPPIVVQFDPSTQTGVDWAKCENRPWHDASHEALTGNMVNFLREGVEKMTGQKLEVKSSPDLSAGIVLTTLAGADDSIRRDPAVLAALKKGGTDAYNDQEAYYIRSEPRRLLVVANNYQGLTAAMPELLESVGYEVLGMGPNWTHVPAEHRNRLAFKLERAGRPGYYLRGLSPTSGQTYGVGTIVKPEHLSDPADETVFTSFNRWQIGRRMKTRSMPPFPGHAIQAYHKAAAELIRDSGKPEGFLADTKLGLDSARPAAAETNGQLWINTDPKDTPGHGKVFYSQDGKWAPGNLASLPFNLDLSVPAIRQLIFENFLKTSEAHFAKTPNEVFIFGTDPEDGGGYAVLNKLLKNPDWYPDYLASTGRKLGAPYSLHGFKGLDQPQEIWDPSSASDTVYGFNNWLLWEYDRWLAARPKPEQVTSTSKPKKDAVRCSFYSYNYHDVPPNFNPDPRIRVMIASYPKNRGQGKWKKYASQTDLAQAFAVMLPKEPSGDYWIISLSYFQDRTLDALGPRWEGYSNADLVRILREHYAAGFRALSVETDFNFGRLGLHYYLFSQLLWNPGLTVEELDAIRDRWLQRAFGSGWEPMKRYYDYRLTQNYPVNSPHAWSRAIRMIEEAEKLIDPAKEPDARRRLDDLKQFWYYYYLVDTKEDKSTSPVMREFFWKSQMSYMNASHVIARTIFATSAVDKAAGDLTGTRAHFTAEETAAWWPKVLAHWPVVPVTRFDELTLANGKSAREVDVNDLVAVKEFGEEPARQGLIYNAGYQKTPTFRQVAQAGEEIGFNLIWPTRPDAPKDAYYIAKDVSWGLSRWKADVKDWEPLMDQTMTVQPSRELTIPGRKVPHNVCTVRFKAPQAGTYRFEIGRGGNLGMLTDLTWDPATDQHAGSRSLTYDGNAEGLTQAPAYIYIPKGTKSLDLEVWDTYNKKTLTLYRALPPTRANQSRQVDVSERKTHRVELQPEETGTIAEIGGNGFSFPYLYSVPMLWAKAPGQLLVPRAVAEADGLTPK